MKSALGVGTSSPSLEEKPTCVGSHHANCINRSNRSRRVSKRNRAGRCLRAGPFLSLWTKEELDFSDSFRLC